MTIQLIPVFSGTISNETALLCNARDLHTFLEVGKRFATWITERISEYQFIENQDFLIISQNREKISRGRPAKDYHLTLDTAKELAMVERNEKGRQIRRYFIECEKKLRQDTAKTENTIRNYLLSVQGDNVSVRPLSPNTLITEPDNIVDALRKRGWVVMKKELLVQRLMLL
ncbi:TPA: antA/AntB antirepressor family protein [Salmonella enterica subsp. houtenae serovar 43:z4,z23:-]|nr:antA/AntB antirepressor family protein [Salmonella enterica subsp. houtenae serovar Houten]